MEDNAMEKKLKPVVKIFLTSHNRHGEPFCGPGMIQLLDTIDETGNVRKACANLELSYSKGWKLLRTAEECAGFTLLVRQQGGYRGGGATLTPEGKCFVRAYRDFTARCQTIAEEIFTADWPPDLTGLSQAAGTPHAGAPPPEDG